MAIDKYLDNITSQHRDKPKFINWLSENLTILDHTHSVVENIDTSFDLDNAIGAQLDTLGTIIGRSRILTFQPLNNLNPVLEDDYYRLILKTKIAMNNWNGTIPEMYQIWDNIFGNDEDLDLQIQDNQDMSFDAYITGYVDQIQQDLIQHHYIIPKPEGVKANYIGRSKLNLGLYSAMVVTVCKTEVINMTFDPVERMDLIEYSRITVLGIKTETLYVSDKVISYDYLVDSNKNNIIDKDGNFIVSSDVSNYAYLVDKNNNKIVDKDGNYIVRM